MNYTKPRGPVEIGSMLEMEMEENVRVLPREIVRAPATDDGGSSADSLNELLARVSETSRHEIDNLIDELQLLRGKLKSDTDRIQRDIAKYATVSDQVMQLTKIISESMQKLPDAPGITP
jgi:methyl-accepting chemotaxis protein